MKLVIVDFKNKKVINELDFDFILENYYLEYENLVNNQKIDLNKVKEFNFSKNIKVIQTKIKKVG